MFSLRLFHVPRWLVLCALAAAPALAAASQGARSAALPPGILALDGGPAPPLALADMDANRFDLRQARGHWVFVHFWASWCGPCRREMPAIQRMAHRLDDPRLRVELVNVAESADTVFTFLGVTAPDLGSLLDRDGAVADRWEPRGLPATYLVDPRGRLRYQALGGRPWDKPAYLDFLRGLLGPRR